MRFRVALAVVVLLALGLAVRSFLARGEKPGPPSDPASEPAAGAPAAPDIEPAAPEGPGDEAEAATADPSAEAVVVSEEGEPLGDYRIGGVVVTPDGAAVAGVEVTLNPPFDPAVAVLTGADGRFGFSGLGVDGDRFPLRIVAPGHAPVDQYAAPGRTDLRIVVGAVREVAGVVVMPDGSPAAGAQVTLAARTVTTDAEGRFRFAAEPVRTEPVVAGREFIPRFGPETKPFPRWRGEVLLADGPTTDLRIELVEIHRSFVRARVVDDSGAPQAKIVLYHARWGVTEGPSGEDGRITIAVGHPPGATVSIATLDAEPGGTRPRARFQARTAASPAEAEEVLVVLPAWRRLTVVAVEEDGAPLPDDVTVEFKAWLGEARPDPDAPVLRDRATFLVHPSPRFEPYLSVSAPGFVALHTRIRVPERGDEIRFPLSRGTAVTGRLVDGSGRPVIEGTVEAWAGHRCLGGGASAGPEGEFRVEGLPPGPAVLAATGPNAEAGGRCEVELASGETVDVGEIRIAAPVRIAGRVTDADGRPLGGARVAVAEEGPGFLPDATRSHADGTFALRVPVGVPLHLLALREGFGTVAVAVDSRDAGRVVPIVMAPEAFLRLHLLRPRPVTGAWSWHVRFPGETFSWQPPGIAGSTNDARLAGGLPPGRLVVFIEGAGGVNEAEVVLRAGETTEVTLEIP